MTCAGRLKWIESILVALPFGDNKSLSTRRSCRDGEPTRWRSYRNEYRHRELIRVDWRVEDRTGGLSGEGERRYGGRHNQNCSLFKSFAAKRIGVSSTIRPWSSKSIWKRPSPYYAEALRPITRWGETTSGVLGDCLAQGPMSKNQDKIFCLGYWDYLRYVVPQLQKGYTNSLEDNDIRSLDSSLL